MKAAHLMIVGATVCMAIGLAGCASTGSSSFLYNNITVADGSTVAGEGHTVLYKGSPQPYREPALKSATLCGSRT